MGSKKNKRDRLDSIGIDTIRWSRTSSDFVRDIGHWKAPEAADAVFIAVPDGAIAEVAQHVAPGLRPAAQAEVVC